MKYGREIMRSVSGRVKSPESIYAKLMRKELPADLETAGKKLNDLVGVRIVCLFLDDVYEIAEILKKQRDVTLVKEKDSISGIIFRVNEWKSRSVLLPWTFGLCWNTS